MYIVIITKAIKKSREAHIKSLADIDLTGTKENDG
jgi:hypothetical protein